MEGLQPGIPVGLAQRRVEITALRSTVVEGDVCRTVRTWAIAPGAAARDIGMIRVEHEGLTEADQLVEVRLTEAKLASIAGRPVDESGVRSSLRTWVTVTLEVTRIEGH
jgi:hypothetical protein